MRIGLVGCGRWGSNYLPLLERANVLSGVCDTNPDVLRAYERSRPGSAVFGGVAGLLASGVDALVIATPPETHAQLAVLALGAGAHVLVEKPIATSVEAAEAVVAAAARARRVCAVGHLTLRHEVLSRRSAPLRSIGRIERVTAERTSLGAVQGAASHATENALFGLAVHDVATLLGPLGLRARRVRARSISAEHAEQAVALELVLDGPGERVVAEIRASRLGPSRVRRLEIAGADGTFTLDELADERGADLLDRQVRAFLGRIAGGDVSPREARLGADVVRVLASAQASLASSGGWIEWTRPSEALSDAP